MTAGTRRVVERCREQLGPVLRTVTAYDDDGFDVLYVRDDLRTRYSRERFEGLISTAREVHAPLWTLPDGEEDAPLGGFRASIHAFEEAAALQAVVSAERGYLVSVDRDAIQRLEGLVEALDRAKRE